ncbi:MAG: MerR family transcriptional regulator [Candidatus Hydrogenedentota bacterium]|nr:MAG: MerR family transcriptional regulator [Candidatus Hydrogenedentota bacterium]
MDGEAPRKIYFSIGEVSAMTDVPQHVLRYWEEVFPSLRPPKRRSGSRAYRQRDIEKVRLIKRLLYNEGYTIRGARKRLREEMVENGGVEGFRSVSDVLSEIERGLQRIMDTLDSDE